MHVGHVYYHHKSTSYNFTSFTCRKQCVQSFNVFDFLRDTVRKVPDLGGAEAANEDRTAAKRRLGCTYKIIAFWFEE